jgi:hypothetical protein
MQDYLTIRQNQPLNKMQWLVLLFFYQAYKINGREIIMLKRMISVSPEYHFSAYNQPGVLASDFSKITIQKNKKNIINLLNNKL